MYRWPRFLVLLPLLVACACAAAPTGRAPQLPAEALEQIDRALPDRAGVFPAKPRRLLIFTGCKGPRHTSIAWGAAAVERLGHRTGAYEPVVSDDIAMFEPDTLKQFDAVFFVNSTYELFLPEPKDFAQLAEPDKHIALLRDARLKQSLLDFVYAGGGLAGCHAAADSFYDWPGFRTMLGAAYDGHPWNDAKEVATLKVEEPDHPLSVAFAGTAEFKIADELYQFKEPYSREKLRVLLSVDLAKTQTTRPYTTKNMRRADGDYAVSWIRRYGAGRVFYCSLGHAEASFTHPTVLRHFLNGIQFTLGDLQADATPSVRTGGAQ